MASQLHILFTPYHAHNHRLLQYPDRFSISRQSRANPRTFPTIRVSNDGDSYLAMWKNAMDRQRKEKIAENVDGEDEDEDELEIKNNEFLKILEVSTEERDRIQRMQVIDRAAAAIAVASKYRGEDRTSLENDSYGLDNLNGDDDDDDGEDVFVSDPQQGSPGISTPGPNFWSWIPPTNSDSNTNDEADLASSQKTSTFPSQPNPVMELEPYVDYLSLPLESKTESNYNPPLPPLQSLMEVEEQVVSGSIFESPKDQVDNLFSTHAKAAANALVEVDPVSCEGINPDGSKWWKETGIEVRPGGVVCRWTLTRGVSADKAVEWEEKYWEAADELGYKELGSVKSGRDAAGNVWREFWKESMSLIEGCLHIEKTADKWGGNGKGDEWQEKWFEHYGAGQAEKWAHKWCSIDPTTQLKVGHAHVWHERWGEKYDGQGGSVKYTDKWAERSEVDGWTKWGDKWDEHFDPNGHGVKQGETWWQGKQGERWNKTWGEGHNGSGWIHKYGKSSSGDHWDTHVQQDTWYERYPHYGFYHCFENSVSLRQVKKPSEKNSS